MGRFDGQVVLITGAGGGLGRAYAVMLAGLGATIVVNDAAVPMPSDGGSPPAAAAVVAEIEAAGGTAMADSHDVVTDAAALVGATVERFGRLDVVINNAGIGAGGPADPATLEAAHRCLDITVRGSLDVTTHAWEHLVASGNGRVIMTSSPASYGSLWLAPYSAAKSAMIGMTRSLAADGAYSGVRVNAVLPSAMTRLTRMMPPSTLMDLLEMHYPASAAASFMVWLVDPDNDITGELFTIGGRRAGRVQLVEGRGLTVDDDDPRSWDRHRAALMSDDLLAFPSDMVDATVWQSTAFETRPPALLDGGAEAWDWSKTRRTVPEDGS